MRSPVTCPTCGLTTGAGCGQHADQVMACVPAGARCTCPLSTEPTPPTPSR